MIPHIGARDSTPLSACLTFLLPYMDKSVEPCKYTRCSPLSLLASGLLRSCGRPTLSPPLPSLLRGHHFSYLANLPPKRKVFKRGLHVFVSGFFRATFQARSQCLVQKSGSTDLLSRKKMRRRHSQLRSTVSRISSFFSHP